MSAINIKSRKAHSKSAISIGYFFMGLGIITMVVFFNPIPFFIFSGIGAYFSFSYYGFEVNDAKTEYREFGYYLGVKIGKWQELKNMPYLTIFYITQSETTGAGRVMLSITNEEMVYKVFLLSNTHRTRVLIIQTLDKNEAKEMVELLEKELGLKYVKYNPQRMSKRR